MADLRHQIDVCLVDVERDDDTIVLFVEAPLESHVVELAAQAGCVEGVVDVLLLGSDLEGAPQGASLRGRQEERAHALHGGVVACGVEVQLHAVDACSVELLAPHRRPPRKVRQHQRGLLQAPLDAASHPLLHVVHLRLHHVQDTVVHVPRQLEGGLQPRLLIAILIKINLRLLALLVQLGDALQHLNTDGERVLCGKVLLEEA
mmetsp:Transcript_38704/g.100279  ORF Transcript_38704/g.100279 Transcript_38704/m.100279 type:complete len:204 (-) Transcript_38704:892-1503(-)